MLDESCLTRKPVAKMPSRYYPLPFDENSRLKDGSQTLLKIHSWIQHEYPKCFLPGNSRENGVIFGSHGRHSFARRCSAAPLFAEIYRCLYAQLTGHPILT